MRNDIMSASQTLYHILLLFSINLSFFLLLTSLLYIFLSIIFSIVFPIIFSIFLPSFHPVIRSLIILLPAHRPEL